MKKQKLSSLLPIAVFLIFYLGLGIWSEYIMKIPMGFYNIPIVVAFMLAILTACFQNRSLSFDRKLELMGQGIGDKNIITMLLIFLTAGTFVGVVGRSSAESVAYLMLSLIRLPLPYLRPLVSLWPFASHLSSAVPCLEIISLSSPIQPSQPATVRDVL